MSGLALITVVRALGGLGDVLCAVPALALLRAANPGARISYIGLPAVAPVVARYPRLVDRFLPFPGFPGIPEASFTPAALHDFLEERAAEIPADLALQMHGSGSVSNVFTALLGARRMAGWHVPGLWCPDAETFAAFPDHLAEVDRWTALVARLGFAGDAGAFFPIDPVERRATFMRFPELAKGHYAIIHPGASDPRRRWPPDRFAQVADALARTGLRIVLTGTAAEAPLTARVAAAMTMPAVDLTGATDLASLAALIEGAAIVVTNDTGTSHLAAALGTRSIVIFIASDPARWAPADRARHLVIGEGVPDQPIGAREPPRRPRFPQTAEALAAAASLLEVA